MVSALFDEALRGVKCSSGIKTWHSEARPLDGAWFVLQAQLLFGLSVMRCHSFKLADVHNRLDASGVDSRRFGSYRCRGSCRNFDRKGRLGLEGRFTQITNLVKD